MTTTPFPFKVLFWFENEEKIIAEIKRTGIQSEDKSLVYKWIIREKEIRRSSFATEPCGESSQNNDPNKFSILTFQSMSQIGNEQIREFSEGTLKWNVDEALFNDETLHIIEPENVSNKWLELVAGFLIKI
ncbi:MAG: hypothetical protein ACO1N0_06870 [Fluviicola sp.]